jgi:protein-S-isoprenylcysteine O-methyltransferase Ste14
MIAKLFTRTAIWLAGMALLLFAPAGTWHWPGAWIFLGISAASGIGMGLWLARSDPDLLEQRMGPPLQRGQQAADKLLIVVLMLGVCAWFAVMGFDVGHRHSEMPSAAAIAGAGAVIACMYVAFLTFRANTFAAPVVRVQHERGQRVIDTGPYAVVRHPMYAGALLYFIGVPLLLGSWLGLLAAPLLAALLAARIVLEERTLRAELPGYAGYTARVPRRLLPGLW